MESLTDAERRAIHSAYFDRIANGKGLLPTPKPLPFDPVPAIKSVRWRNFLICDMVDSELRELTNQMNQWLGTLGRWHAWNDVLAGHDEDFRWRVEWEAVESLAFQCMAQPSATRDRFVMVATNALHQVRMALDPGVEDELLGDPTKPGDHRFFPSRHAKEHQLKAFANAWPTGKAFIQALGQMDNLAYRRLTSDFRNRANHGIAPRLSVGYTALVTRSRRQQTRLQQQPNKTYEDVPVPEKMVTSYGWGGTPPLTMEKARLSNLAQAEHARRTFNAYVALLVEATAAMPKLPEPVPADTDPAAQEVG